MSGKYSVKKFSTSNKFDGFGCAVSAPITGDKLQACKELLLHRYRSTVGFYWPTDFIKDGMLTESMYHEIIDTIKNELDKQAEIARESKSEIVTVARELGLGPEPTGTGPYSWRARCPKTSHPLYINTESNTFGCGWCKRKGGPGELQAFMKERRSKKS